MKHLGQIILTQASEPTSLWSCMGPTHPSMEYGTIEQAVRASHDPDPTPMHVHFTLDRSHIKPGDWILEFKNKIPVFYMASYSWATKTPNPDKCRRIVATTDYKYKLTEIHSHYIKNNLNKLRPGNVHDIVVEMVAGKFVAFEDLQIYWHRTEVRKLFIKFRNDLDILNTDRGLKDFTEWLNNNVF